MKYTILLVILALPAHAETAQEMVTQCRQIASDAPMAALKGAFCAGYMAGVMDGSIIQMAVGEPARFCPPTKGLSPEAISDLLAAHLITHPDQATDQVRMPLMAALVRAFPCPKGK